MEAKALAQASRSSSPSASSPSFVLERPSFASGKYIYPSTVMQVPRAAKPSPTKFQTLQNPVDNLGGRPGTPDKTAARVENVARSESDDRYGPYPFPSPYAYDDRPSISSRPSSSQPSPSQQGLKP
mmetsp:Transcript_42881/g.69556  ORF Transcript_42881/g.69556 Transcript_42881/m.69556 type:complete len:126 (+) Transcript_42881:147-524(+)